MSRRARPRWRPSIGRDGRCVRSLGTACPWGPGCQVARVSPVRAIAGLCARPCHISAQAAVSLTTVEGLGYIGKNMNSQHFDGRIDDVRVYDRLLTPSEIATLHDAGF